MRRTLKPLLYVAITLIIPLLLWFACRMLGTRSDGETLLKAEQAVRRAAVQCYALEGFYPTDLSYLQEHYGVTAETQSYAVGYLYVADNLMPDITILPQN